MTFEGGNARRFELADGWNGTSMATAHVTAAAALIRASGVVGRNPTPGTLERRLESTARVLGPEAEYGAGLLDAARATAR